MVSLCYIGNLVAAGIFFTFVDNCSRKFLIFLTLVLNVICWTLNLIATDIRILYLSSSICGIAYGIYDINTYNYLGEVCSPSLRGVFGALTIVCYIFATELSFVLATFNSPFLLSVVPLIISLLASMTWFMTSESPYYLAMKGKTEDSYKVLTYLNDKEVKQQHEEIVKFCQEENSIDFSSYLKNPENLKLCITVIIINMMVYVSSFAIFIGYGPTLLSPFNLDLQQLKYIILAAISIFTLLSVAMVKIFSPRSLIWMGFTMLTVVQLCLGILFSIAESYDYQVPYLGQAIITCGIFYFWVYLLTVYPAVHVLRSEIFPPKFKERGSCVLVILKTFAEFGVGAIFYPLILMVGTEVNFYIYSLAAAVGGLCARRWLKETQGKTLVEIWKEY